MNRTRPTTSNRRGGMALMLVLAAVAVAGLLGMALLSSA
jgi:hypothetical protein